MATIPISDVLDVHHLPIDAQDVVTKVNLVVAGNRAGAEPSLESMYARDDGIVSFLDNVVLPITYTYEAPEHSVYGAERSFAVPEGVSPFLLSTDERIPEPAAVGITNPGSPSAVRDGDPVTYAELSGGGGASIVYTLAAGTEASRLFAGFRVTYGMFGSDALVGRRVSVQRNHFDSTPELRLNVTRWWTLSDTGGVDQRNELYGVSPDDARVHAANRVTEYQTLVLLSLFVNGSARVTNFYPLLLNEALLEDLAKRQVRLPGEVPQRVTVKGIVPPDRTHTITGWPGGDYTGVVAQHQYELGRTIVDFEQAGSPLGLPAEALEAARERRVAIDRAVADAAYPVRMGERL